MNSYHGTSKSIAIDIASGKVDVCLGGGELGQGFYTGSTLHEAKSWAFHRYGDKTKNVVAFSSLDSDVEQLHFDVLDPGTTNLKRSQIKKLGQTRTHLFNLDMVWAPIVGSERASGDQYKWESMTAENLLNGAATTKVIT